MAVSDHACLFELGLHDFAVEGLHDVFVGAGANRLVNLLDIGLRGA